MIVQIRTRHRDVETRIAGCFIGKPYYAENIRAAIREAHAQTGSLKPQ